MTKSEEVITDLCKQLRDAQATIAALQARAEQAERLVASQAQEIIQRRQTLGDLAHLHQEQSKQLTQRTAELEAAKRLATNAQWQIDYLLDEVKKAFELTDSYTPSDLVDCVLRPASSMLKERDELKAELERVKQELRDADEKADEYRKALHDVETERVLPLSIELERVSERVGPQGLEVVMIGEVGHYVSTAVKEELERVRGELVWANQCRQDAAAMTEQLTGEVTTLRTLLLALPKVEGEIDVYTGKNTNQVVVTYKRGVIIGTLYGLDHAKPVAALYKHRQGMEG